MPRRPTFGPYPKLLHHYVREFESFVSDLTDARRELALIRKMVEKRGIEARAEGHERYEERAELVLHIIEKMTKELGQIQTDLTDQRGDFKNLAELLSSLDEL